MKSTKVFFAVLWLYTVTACSAADNPPQNNKEDLPVSVQKVWQSSYCPIKETALKVLLSDAELSKITRGNQLNSKPAVTFSDIGSHYHLLLVSQGEKPSGGYSLDLVSTQVKIENKTAKIEMAFNQPKENSLQTMAISAPCLLIKMAKSSDYERVEILGKKQLSVDITIKTSE